MRKISDEEKVKQGTIKKSRIKQELNYDPLGSIPAPAFKLNKDGVEFYERFCSILISNRTLTVADIPGITRAARWFEMYKDADKHILKEGPVQTTSTGYTQQTGWFTVMEKTEDRILKFEALYGMNLTARTKINLPKPEKKNDFDGI
jgi:P27 family predicted phage terminase small subunit